jgi:hypothetical protein
MRQYDYSPGLSRYSHRQGGRLRDEVPFASYIFFRHAGTDGKGRVANAQEVVAYTNELHGEFDFPAIKFKGRVPPPDEEIEVLRELLPKIGGAVRRAAVARLCLDGRRQPAAGC